VADLPVLNPFPDPATGMVFPIAAVSPNSQTRAPAQEAMGMTPPAAPAAPPPAPAAPAEDAGFPLQLTPAQPLMVPITQTESSTTTQGVDKATAGRINEATGQANAAASAAGDAQMQQQRDAADLEMRQSREAYGRGVNNYFERQAELQTQDEIERETTARLDASARFKPDRTALFNGDKGAAFGISAAISAMAGGWLMGQGLTGGRNPYLDAVLNMIEDNANDQIAANGRVYQELSQRLGDTKAAKAALKAKMLEAVDQTIDAQSRFQKAGTVQRGAAATKAQVQAEIAKNNLEAAKLTGKTVSSTVQRKQSMAPNPAIGIDVTNPQEYQRVGKVASLQNLAAEAQGLADSGALAENVGFFDEAGNWVAGAFNARDPKQARVERVRAMWELVNRADWSSEPNGQAVQERLAGIGWPKNDSEIPLFLQSVREALNTADPGGRYRIAARAMGNQPNAPEQKRFPIVRRQGQ
jgi:hypothetical protein